VSLEGTQEAYEHMARRRGHWRIGGKVNLTRLWERIAKRRQRGRDELDDKLKAARESDRQFREMIDKE